MNSYEIRKCNLLCTCKDPLRYFFRNKWIKVISNTDVYVRRSIYEQYIENWQLQSHVHVHVGAHMSSGARTQNWHWDLQHRGHRNLCIIKKGNALRKEVRGKKSEIGLVRCSFILIRNGPQSCRPGVGPYGHQHAWLRAASEPVLTISKNRQQFK